MKSLSRSQLYIIDRQIVNRDQSVNDQSYIVNWGQTSEICLSLQWDHTRVSRQNVRERRET